MTKRTLLKRLLPAIAIAAITIACFALLEGLAGTAMAAWDITRNSGGGLQSRQHAVHDTLLGWINTPGFHDADMYGPGLTLAINASSFRDLEDVPAREPDKLRIVCSGDSFTFGIGVTNDDTWCAMLERYDPRIRSINLAHAGYGVDQAYLHYRRDGEALEHAVHVFAFIPDDLRRARLSRFAGYNKPYFSIEGETLELQHVPVPELSDFGIAVLRRRERLNELHIMKFVQRLTAGRRRSDTARPEYVNSDTDATRIAIALMDSLQAVARTHDQVALFVLLDQAFIGNRQTDSLAVALGDSTRRRGLNFIDLRSSVRTLAADSLEAMFDRRASGHYSVAGHARVARLVWQALSQMPGFNSMLDAITDD